MSGNFFIIDSLLPLAQEVGVLHIDPANARTKHDLARIAASLKQYGQRKPIVANRAQNGKIEAGNGTFLAAKKLGWSHVAVVWVDDDAATAAAYGIADNRTAELSQWDPDALAKLQPVVGDMFTGFEAGELAEVLGAGGGEPTSDNDAEPQVGKAEELRQKWNVETGKMWRLPSRNGQGEHRLICGDCTERAIVEQVMGGGNAQIVFTDPPYGVAIGAKNRMLNSFQKAGRNLTDIVNDEMSPDELKQRLLPAFNLIRNSVMSDDCTIFLTAPQGGELGMMMMMMAEAKLPIRHVLIWKKNAPTFSMGRLDYDYQHEPILLTWGKRHKRPMTGQHKTSVWEIDKPRSSVEHPTMKPPELYMNAYLNNSDRGDIAYEPYCGSGTALIAGENTGRYCRAVEISPAYVAVALQRYVDAFGVEPELI